MVSIQIQVFNQFQLRKMNLIIRRVPKYWHNTHAHKDMQLISKMPFFQAYRKGVTLTMNQQYEEANKKFQQSLTKIRQARQDAFEHYIQILRKIAANNNKLGRFKATENTLYQIIKHKKKHKINSALIYDDYDILFNHLLRYDLQKAIILGKALLNDREISNLPISHIKTFQFNLANAYLLEGNYPDAKKRYWKCLEAEPNNILRSRVLNNLAVCCWWHKNPIFPNVSNQVYSGYQNESIDKDFGQTMDLFKQSIFQSENLANSKDQERRINIQEVLNQGKMVDSVRFVETTSLTPITNISEFNINNNPLNRPQILFWLQQGLILSSTAKRTKQFDRISTQLSLLSNDEKLSEKLGILTEKYKDTFEEIFYRKLMHMISLSQKENGKAENQKQRLLSISKNFREWEGKFYYLSMQKYHI